MGNEAKGVQIGAGQGGPALPRIVQGPKTLLEQRHGLGRQAVQTGLLRFLKECDEIHDPGPSESTVRIRSSCLRSHSRQGTVMKHGRQHGLTVRLRRTTRA